MKWTLALFVFFLGIAPAIASNWISIGTSSANSRYYLDTDSVRSGSQFSLKYIVAWIKVDSTLNKTASVNMGGKANIRRHIAESKILYHIQCDEHKMRIASYVDYDASGAVLASRNFDFAGAFNPVVPESVGELILDRVCEYAGLSFTPSSPEKM